jgi:hypothetical protein
MGGEKHGGTPPDRHGQQRDYVCLVRADSTADGQ